MKKKVIIVITVILVILLAIGIMYTVDRYMMKNSKPVIFSTWGYNYAPPETTYEILEIIDKTNSNAYTCATALEKIYEDYENEYYFSCIKSHDIIVKYKNEYEENVKVALNKGHITLKDLDTYNIGYTTKKKDVEETNSFVGTILEETTTYMIVEPNEDESERKSADKIVINYGKDHIDYLYGVGRKVVIYYTGAIMETYPAQIKTDNISHEGYSDFEISVKKASDIKTEKILNNKDIYKNNSEYNLYYYGLDEINVKVDNTDMTLKDALKSGKVTLERIVSKANEDLNNGKITGDKYIDGGSKIYKYDEYTIIKCHSLDGNRDLWIGIPEMTIGDIK